MTENAKKAGSAARLASSLLAKGYRPEALHQYTDRDGIPLYYRIRLKHPVTGDKWIRPMKRDGDSYVLGEPKFPTVSLYIAQINCTNDYMKLCTWSKANNALMS